MKFILSQDGTHAVKSEIIEEMYLDPEEPRTKSGKRVKYFTVEVAIFAAETSITMARFYSDDADENFRAAKKYLADLVAELNGGTE